jgi:hypothetical protein
MSSPIQPPDDTRENPSEQPTSPEPPSALPAHMAAERQSSSAKRPLYPDAEPIFSTAALSDVPSDSLDRTNSTSSRFGLDRPQSPYRGPTAPSQPYAMYPQVTRASSIASESTVRPVERPFVGQSGPEHPYAMYQNAVPEEEDDDSDHSSPSLAFAGAPGSFNGGSSSSGNDTGDIVGSDGHIEQLPPYTRYADNVVAKGDMAQINGDSPAVSSAESASPTDNSSLSPNTTSSETHLQPNPETEAEAREVARKEGLYERSKRRKCCGIPLIILVLLILVIVVSAAVGGVVGGVVGNRKGVDHAKAVASEATTTVWLDADPVETDSATPTCPTGHFSIPFQNIGQVERCVTDESLADSWDCSDSSTLGVTILREGPDGSADRSITFDDYSNVPRLFQYGPQPPDFNGTKFILQPVEDRDNRDFGVAMFFSYLFDKLVICELPGKSCSTMSLLTACSTRK